ncbi:unnamed protein product, partial [Meganyctiphanes norvegica]
MTRNTMRHGAWNNINNKPTNMVKLQAAAYHTLVRPGIEPWTPATALLSGTLLSFFFCSKWSKMHKRGIPVMLPCFMSLDHAVYIINNIELDNISSRLYVHACVCAPVCVCVCMCLISYLRVDSSRVAVTYCVFIGALLSLITLTVTMFIFTYFRSLECERLRVHRNLVLSLIFTMIINIVMTESAIFRPETDNYRDINWLCKSLIAASICSRMATINWMFVEGLFLHSRLTSNVFDSGAPFILYYTIGWGLPVGFTSGWAIVMYMNYHEDCWHNFAKEPYVFIVVAPMITALLINLLFLINIIRILVTKLQASDAVETARVRKAIKATLVLFPLLGIPNLLAMYNPRDNATLEGAYMVANALLQSCMGVVVSILYCFLNSEVQGVLKTRWWQYRVRHQPDMYVQTQRRKSTKSSITLTSTFSLS